MPLTDLISVGAMLVGLATVLSVLWITHAPVQRPEAAMTTADRDWMARPGGRFLIWWLYLVAACAFVALVIGLLEAVEWAVTRLTDSRTTVVVIGTLVLLAAGAAFNAWLWTPGNRAVQTLVRVMQRMEGR